MLGDTRSMCSSGYTISQAAGAGSLMRSTDGRQLLRPLGKYAAMWDQQRARSLCYTNYLFFIYGALHVMLNCCPILSERMMLLST